MSKKDPINISGDIGITKICCSDYCLVLDDIRPHSVIPAFYNCEFTCKNCATHYTRTITKNDLLTLYNTFVFAMDDICQLEKELKEKLMNIEIEITQSKEAKS